MKKIHYIYVCLGALLLSVLPARAASEAEFGKLVKTYTLHEDGSQEMRVYKELTLFTHPAMNSLYGETFIIYNPAYQELKVHDSYTRQKDGTVIKTPENAFVEVLPFAAADAPAYNGLKEMVIVHTGLELGATIYLDYSVITRPNYLSELDICTQVEELSPIKEYVCSVSVPESKLLHYALANGSVPATVKSENGNKVVTWTLKNVPAYYPTESTPALSGNVQVILAHTYASVADALKVLRSQFTAADDKEVTALAQKLLKGKKENEKEAILKSYVRGLGTCRLSLENTGYRLRPASEVIRTAYGTEAEKVNLLAGLMKAAGLPADVKAAYAVKAENDNLGLSAIAELFLESPGVADRQDYQPVLTLEGQKVTLETRKPVNETDTLKVTLETGRALAGGYRLVTLPRTQEGIALYRYGSGNSECKTNLLLPRKVDETYTCIVSLPATMQVCTPQKAKEITNAVGTLRIAMKTAGGHAEVVRSLKLNKQLITPADYAAFRRLMTEWEDSNNATLLLKAR